MRWTWAHLLALLMPFVAAGELAPKKAVLFLHVFPNGEDEPSSGAFVRVTKEVFGWDGGNHNRFVTLMNQALEPEFQTNHPEKVVTEAGDTVKAFDDLLGVDRVYVVPEGFHFHWPGVRQGHRQITNVRAEGQAEPIVLETLSLSPKVFKVHNFISSEEARALIEVNKDSLSRSGTGTSVRRNRSDSVNPHRTSENTFDEDSPLARKLIPRSFEMLRMPYLQTAADGLQVLRYLPGQAYIPHHDQFDLKEMNESDHNFDPRAGGTNRMATVFIYLNDVEEGGETVFPMSKSSLRLTETPTEGGFTNIQDLGFVETDWEADMIHACRNSLAVPPHQATAILFYTQHADGRLDDASFHGGCPVLKGEKWAANMWVWNGPRFGMTSAMNAIFENLSASDVLDVFWVDEEGEGKPRVQVAHVLPLGVGVVQTHAGTTFEFKLMPSGQEGSVVTESGKTHYEVHPEAEEAEVEAEPRHSEL